MKNININTTNAKGGGPTWPALEPVRFEFTHPGARTVCVAGTFNSWHPKAKPMTSSLDGPWLKELRLPPGTWEYSLVMDGKWMADSLATKTVRNPFGRLNSIIKGGPVRPMGPRPSAGAITASGKAADCKTQVRL